MTKDNPNTIPEIWKAIPDFPGYEVSNYGQVRSFWWRGCRHCYLTITPRRILRPWVDHLGYAQVGLCKDNKKHRFKIPRLVLLSFIGPCPPGMETCHNDGNQLNNFLGNLRWDSHANNCADIKKHGSMKGVNGKLTKTQVIQIREIASQGYLQREIGKMFGVSRITIGRIIGRQTYIHI